MSMIAGMPLVFAAVYSKYEGKIMTEQTEPVTTQDEDLNSPHTTVIEYRKELGIEENNLSGRAICILYGQEAETGLKGDFNRSDRED